METYDERSGRGGELMEENERLRTAIKFMRTDLETLRNQSSFSSESQESTKISTLEIRVKQCNQEILKLRDEKRRLMEIGNQMRFEINQLKNNMNFSTSISYSTSIVQDPASSSSMYSEGNSSYKDDKYDGSSQNIKGNSKSVAGDTLMDPWLLVPAKSSDAKGVNENSSVLRLKARQVKIDDKPNFNARKHMLSKASP